MKKKFRRSKGVSKGAPSGFVISLAVHAAAFVLAGMLVVFNVVKKEEKKFVPPKPVDRPKMKLKKPKVKVKKSSKPKATTRIVTKVQKASMPDIQLPEMSGIGGDLAGGIGGFEIMPDLEGVSLLGSSQTIGNDLEGTFYDFKLSRQGRSIPCDRESWMGDIHKFLRSGWKKSVLSKYYRSPKKNYITCLVVPPVLSEIAPSAFGDEEASGIHWMVHYEGQIVHPEGFTFRFRGAGDGFIAVRVNGEIVLLSEWTNVDSGSGNIDGGIKGNLWETDSADSKKYVMGNTRAEVGDWITLEPGVAQDIEIAIGDRGGAAQAMLAVEVEGVEYEKNAQGGPILPAFKTENISRDLMDVIYRDLVEDEISLTTGPVFNDLAVRSSVPEPGPSQPEAPVAAVEPDSGGAPHVAMRVWTLPKFGSVEAELVTAMGGQAVLKNARGKSIKVPLEHLNDADREYVELTKPPKFEVDFTRKSKQRTFTVKGGDGEPRPPQTLSNYGVRIQQGGPGVYNHELHVEMFAIGKERLGDRYILLDHQETTFTPTEENGKSHEFVSERTVVLDNYEISGEPRGEKYDGYLVTVKDKMGKIIEVETSRPWLLEHIETLKMQKPGNYMDKTCSRVYPTRPPRTLY